ncbi:MAG: quinolinate synthase NadA [Kiritimatiellae bacterium]|nr:quinolinate synthase NadA [Kiritimatiellia bacterium]
MEAGKPIEDIRREWGRRLLILAHHYQRPSVVAHADAIGDSLELARLAAREKEAERIVFCGVHFMAETAEMLTAEDQTVYMPDVRAGCPMADMATEEQVRVAWSALCEQGGDWLPVVYVNSSAAIKAFCGEAGGSACTSSNAAKVFEWVFGQGKRVFFLPDEHLGVNTAADLGIPDGAVAVYDPEPGGTRPGRAALRAARVVVWKGYCHVHTSFGIDQIRAVRERLPEAKIIVHPEVPREAARAADAHGSTAQIVRYVKDAPRGSTIVIGTELHFVSRLADEHAGRVAVRALAQSVCGNMARTTEQNLLALLQSWPDENIVRVREQTARPARACLERMLELG